MVLIALAFSVSAFANNLIINGDFETGDDTGWPNVFNSAIERDPITASYALKGWGTGLQWGNGGAEQSISVTAGETYAFSADAMNPAGPPADTMVEGAIAEIRVTFKDAGGNNLNGQWGESVDGIDNTAQTGSWIALSGSVTAPAGTVEAVVQVQYQNTTTTAGGAAWFDNISVTSDTPLNNPNYNDDNIVNLLDFSELSGVWNQESDSHNLSGNAFIGLDDLVIFADAWLTTIPGYSIYELVWEDEFYGTSLNPANWEYMIGDGCSYGICGWGNNELQYYRAANVSVSDGKLVIEARQENYADKQFTSGRIRTYHKQDFLYGKMEARIKVPTGGGMWPTFWMMPTDSVYGGWAASGEIDIMETRNQTNYIQGTIHYGGRAIDGTNTYSSGTYAPGGIDFSQDFHVYSLEWEPDVMRWYVDGILYSTKTSDQWYTDAAPGNNRAPFDQEFYLLLNIAVGGNYPGCTDPGCITADFPQQMIVDWVRVYQKTDP